MLYVCVETLPNPWGFSVHRGERAVQSVGSSDLTAMITFRNVLRAKVLGFYISKLALWARFGPDLAHIMSFDPFCHWYRLK